MSLESLAVLNDLAAGQWGLLTTRQASREGVSRVQLARLVDAGVLERVGQGIYSMTSTNDRFQALHAAWLSLDPFSTAEERLSTGRDAVVASHTSAAALHEMGDLPSDVPELNTAIRKQTVRPMKLHRLPLPPEDVTLVDGLPTTTPERTIADLIRSGHDLSHVADATRDGVRSGALDRRKLCEQLERVATRTGHPDGMRLQQHLLDLAGFSVAAAANSELGRKIAVSAVQQYQAALANLLDSVNPAMKDLARTYAATALTGDEFASALQTIKQSLDAAGFPAAQAAALQTFSSMLPKTFASDTALDTLPFLQTAWAQQTDSWNQPAAIASNKESEPRKTKVGT